MQFPQLSYYFPPLLGPYNLLSTLFSNICFLFLAWDTKFQTHK